MDDTLNVMRLRLGRVQGERPVDQLLGALERSFRVWAPAIDGLLRVGEGEIGVGKAEIGIQRDRLLEQRLRLCDALA
jgi:hypothetical protein